MTASKILLFFCLSFIGGIFVASFRMVSQPVLLVFLILGIFLIAVFWSKKNFVIAGLCVLFLVGGVWRHQSAELRIMNDELRTLNDREEKITLVGIVSQEPDLRARSQRLTIKPETVLEHPEVRPQDSYVLVTAWRYPEYQYGDKLKIAGKLETPQTIDNFNYRDYLKKDRIYSVISFPEIELFEKNQGSFVYAKILIFKEKLRTSLYQNLSPPQSAILGAMILGDKRQLSEEIKNDLNITGVRHITAISGLHVTVLSVMIMSFLLLVGFWRQQAFWLSMVLIILFIVMTGLQPSALRAGIMGGLFLLAQYIGRQNASSRTIILAAAVMLFHNPFLLRLDAGFQLSFLAMLGIIYLLPTFQDWLKFIPWDNARNILAMTFSAYIFTLPMIIYNFSYLSLIAPLSNLLIVPLLYPIMLFGFLAGLAGMIFQALGWILSLPVWLLLTYLTTVVNLLAKLPFSYVALQNRHWFWLIPCYAILGFITYKLQERQRLKFLNY